MTKHTLSFVGAFILLLLVSYSAQAQQGNSIRGRVRAPSGNTLPRVVVDLQTGNGLPAGKTVANDEGDFYFSGLTETSYQVTVSALDFETITEPVDFSNNVDENRPGETRMIEIMLTPNPTTRLAPGRVTFAQDVPPLARSTYERGLKLYREGKTQESVAAMQDAIKIFPDYFNAHFALGSELMKLGRFNEAITEFDYARRVNPKDDRVYLAFGIIMMQQKKYAVAARIFTEAANLNPKDPQYPLMRGVSLIAHALTIVPAKSKADDDERTFALAEAEKSLLHAYEMSGKTLAIVHQHRARIYEKRGDRASAANELEQYLRKNPRDKNARAIREGIKKLRTPTPANNSQQ